MTTAPTRLGAGAAMAGVVVTVTAFALVFLGVTDPFADVSSADYMTAINGSPTLWLGAHLLVCVGLALKLAGLLTIGCELAAAGSRVAAWVAAGFAVAGGTLLLATMAFDGYVHEYLAGRWEQAEPAARAGWEIAFAGSLRGSYGLELLSVLLLLGCASLAFGWGMLRARDRFPGWIGRLAVAQGGGALVTTTVLWIGGPSDAGYGILYPAFAVALPAIWLFAAGYVLWSPAGRHTTAAAAAPVDEGRLAVLAGSRS